MKPKKNIDWLFVLPDDLIGGGAQQVMFHMVNYLIDNGYNCAVIFLIRKKHYGWQKLESKCHIIYLNYTSVYRGYFGAAIFLKAFFKRHNIINVMGSQVLINGLLGLLKSLKIIDSRSKLILRESTSIFLRFKGFKLLIYKIAYRMGYKQADVIICQTQLMKTQLTSALKWLENSPKIIVLPNPVNIEEMSLKGLIPPTINLDEDYVVAAGRIIPEKGFDILIKAFSNLKNKKLKLLLLGIGENSIVQELKTLAEDLNLSERVVFYGFADNVYPLFRHAKLCVISSRIEGFPNTLLQMMSQNTNVVSTLCAGGISEIEGLITCQPNNVEALQNAMENSMRLEQKASIRKKFDNYLRQQTIENFMVELFKKIQ